MTQQPATAVRFTLGKARLHGDLCMPPGACGLVVFVHGAGSSRHSRRNQEVARQFNALGLGTLLFDLLTDREQAIDELTRKLRFDIPLLGQRLTGVVDQLRMDAALPGVRIGLFGASTGAAAALIAAASRPADVVAVVSRGGRVDLADDSLERVHAATLFLVGSQDREVLALNRSAAARLQCVNRLVEVEGAGHLFEEPGKLDEVATLAGDWFVRHLV